MLLSFFSDYDECEQNEHNCDVNARCTNIIGGYSCNCKPGYTGNGTRGNCSRRGEYFAAFRLFFNCFLFSFYRSEMIIFSSNNNFM